MIYSSLTQTQAKNSEKDTMQKLKIFFLVFTLTNFALAKEAGYFVTGDYFIEGFDPVSYITENKASKGLKKFSQTFKGIKILFKSKENKELFLKKPQKFIPAYNGWCAYAMASDGDLVEVDPKSFKVIEGKTYLFYNGLWANTLKKWNKKEDSQQIKKADKNWISYQ